LLNSVLRVSVAASGNDAVDRLERARQRSRLRLDLPGGEYYPSSMSSPSTGPDVEPEAPTTPETAAVSAPSEAPKAPKKGLPAWLAVLVILIVLGVVAYA